MRRPPPSAGSRAERRPHWCGVVDGSYEELGRRGYAPLGRAKSKRAFQRLERHMEAGERVVLYTAGVSQRTTADGGVLGLDGIARAVSAMDDRSAAATVRSVQEAVAGASTEPLTDDSAVVVLAVR